jgi:ribosomal-protein-alanine N-acetyltransferase
MITTDRLQLRHFTLDDAPFILRLLNEPSFLANIGDKGVRTLEQARDYLTAVPLASYAARGYGLYAVLLGETGALIGMCGLVTRPTLDVPDLGYALLPEYWGKGYAREAAQAVMLLARDVHGVERLAAITAPGNATSIRVLQDLGFLDHGLQQLSEGSPEVRLFHRALTPSKE